MQKPTVIGNDKKKAPVSIQRLKSISFISAWLLLTAAVLLVLSGWGITRTEIIYKITFGLVDRRLANYIHRATNIPLVIFFISHVLINARLSLFCKIPHRIRIVDGILIFAGVLVTVLVLYMELWA